MKKIFLILLMTFGLLIVTQSAFAADENVTCTSSDCTPSIITNFFPSSEVWYPGKTMTKTVQITNASGTSQKVGADSSNEVTNGNLDHVMHLTITRSDSSQAWSGLLSSFYANGETELLTSLGNGSSETFAFTVSMDLDAGNEYQNTSTKFDLSIGFLDQPIGKTSSLYTSCTNSNFDAIMELKDNGVVQSGVKVKFTYKGSVQEVNTGSDGKAVAGYSYSTDDEVKAEPDNGYPSQTVTIRYADCQQQSSASSSSAQSSSSAPSGGVLGLFTTFFGGPAVPAGEVAGETTITSTPAPTLSPPETREQIGEVKGIETCNCLWWQILLVEGILASLYYFLVAKNINNRKHNLMGLAGVIATFLVFRLINKCFTYSFFVFANTSSFFCRYFIVLDLMIIVSITLIRRLLLKNQEGQTV
ncbi:hypothetical protein A2334_03015 [Candidatus Roizmanbacteria bacterium RIFOXYB2_FULL_38_10]|uniref:Uncharacterized protein n=1 Tax=Candidatus Roizmanbacteria bacterium RIFOXYD1_FULL_38_12 TaxID=1802093 RepID=A0A1F7L083_9BACT|nr:MAG: hypothetical protein A3K47_01990 [Candidatus Roizmanbacteria bacterium RIFOXYA2_FULL_38_14]OGK63549.1 MAG: hypothetical protein A3K27_01990 [Candidatus Roizmanbacteria bacterium RIFOXYA1_FULL_37_12]OGK65395.1 MAG: hypothetical protein A3K38_01990 [Candidatus Roizmanbacteria bacterium RIFOXYB1_FULL_40_23]OGK69129.1 MAG: hypothetical protein A2334_03015 [Candidatus Roizmanbacteria bacterium RIFOXYB2_FULL_38_10]OGK69800.1 MAG: hypothetical protein A3K21_01995 [Candidatus Roizmanbacteria ba